MRWVVVPFLLAIAGCGPSQGELNQARADRDAAILRLAQEQNRQAALNEAQAAKDCAGREAGAQKDHAAAITHDKEVIMSSLEAVQSSRGDDVEGVAVQFASTIETLDPGQWRWVEVENSAAVSAAEEGTLRDRIHYSVNPGQLSPQVQLVNYQNMPAVRFNCAVGNCIRAIGRRLVRYNGSDSLQDIDEGRSYNVWALGTANRAQLVRDALSNLIEREKNPPVSGRCAPAPSASL